jgi:hypothetical protein
VISSELFRSESASGAVADIAFAFQDSIITHPYNLSL